MSSSQLSRRAFLSNAAKATGGIVTLGILAKNGNASAQEMGTSYSFENLTAQEGKTLISLCERIFPKDDNGPGATDARAYVYIDRSLSRNNKGEGERYRKGLAALEAYSQATKTTEFAALASTEQEKLLIDLDKRETPAQWPTDSGLGSQAFLRMVVTQTMEGLFSDPSYGGNQDKIGWKLIRFPGRSPFGYDPPFGYYDLTIPEETYPEFKPYTGPMQSRILGQAPATDKKKKK